MFSTSVFKTPRAFWIGHVMRNSQITQRSRHGMKTFAAMLLFIAFFFSTAYAFPQSKLTLKIVNGSLAETLGTIKSKTGLSPVYGQALIATSVPVHVNVTNLPLEQVLELIFREQPLTYAIRNGQIVISAKGSAKNDTRRQQIQGQVLDQKETVLPGVSIGVKGSKKGTLSDHEGRFQIDANQHDTLVFSYIGYKTKEYIVSAELKIRVIMELSAVDMEDFVVVAFGKQKKLSVTGAIATIQTKELKQSAVSNLSNALVGRLPGLFARQSSGEPGYDDSRIWLRGLASFSSDATPVILVDGVRRPGFSYIDPNEVESISILKDAASTSVFGVEGANGVVVVTTKRGKSGRKPSVTANVEQAFNQPTYTPKFVNSADYFRLRKIALLNDGKTTEANNITDDFISRYEHAGKDTALRYQYLYPDVDWFKELVRPFSKRTTANLNITGGSERVRYFVSGSYLRDNGLYKDVNPNKDWSSQAREDRYNFRSNVDFQVNDWISSEVNLATIVSNRNFPSNGAGTIWTAIYQTPSYRFPKLNPNGTIAEANQNNEASPFALLTESGYTKEFRAYLQGTVGATFKLDFLLKGLSVKNRFSYDYNSQNGYKRARNYFSFRYNGPAATQEYTPVRTGQDFLGYEQTGNSFARNMTNELYLNYDQLFGQHSLSYMALYRIQNNNAQAGDAIGALPFRTQNFINRVDYNFREKYFLQLVMTLSGSENFAPGRRSGWFPAASAGWIISKEPFMVRAGWLDLLKLRAAAGKVGVQGNTRFAYQSRWNLNSGANYTFGLDYSKGYQSAAPSLLGSPNVTWETEQNYDIGIDLSALRGAIQLEADVFYRKRSDIFFTSQNITPGVFGIPTGILPKINAGEVENKGIELNLKHSSSLFSNVKLDAGVQWSFSRNKILNYVEPAFSERPWQRTAGTRIGEHYGYENRGYFQSARDISGNPPQFGVLQPGDIRYQDVNADKRIDDLDKRYLGKVNAPEHIFGFNLRLAYKGIDVSALFQAATGRYIDIRSDALFGREWLFTQFNEAWKDNYWTPERPNAKLPRLSSDKSENNVTQFSDFWLKDGSYVRFKNFEVGYSLPRTWLKTVKLQNVRIYANGNNLLTWDKLDGLYDPEANDQNGALTYPLLRTFNFGIQISLQ